MYSCVKCGTIINDNLKICPGCGKKVKFSKRYSVSKLIFGFEWKSKL